MHSKTNNLNIFPIALLGKIISFSIFASAERSTIPFINSFSHYTSEQLIYRPPKKLLRKRMDEWYIGFINATEVKFDDDGEIHESIFYKTGKDKVPAQIVPEIYQDGCLSLHNGNTISVINKSITRSNQTYEYDDAMVMINIDFEHLENSDLYSYEDNQLGRLNYCLRTQLYYLNEGSIEEISVSFIDTQFSLTFDTSSFSREF